LRGLRGLLAGLLGSTSVATGLSDAYALSWEIFKLLAEVTNGANKSISALDLFN
jgi:hypothetical protein